MLKRINVGAEVFNELVESNSFYIDKTIFIKNIFEDNTSKVILITRPRRFGKTLTMSTFHDFLALDPENPGDTSRQEILFKETEIFTNEKDFCSRYMGKFPVVFITLKEAFGNDFEGAYDQLGCIVFRMYNAFSYLAESPKLNPAEKSIFRRIADDDEYIRNVANKNKIKDSLSNLLMFLNKHHGIKPILLIDEYDVPIAKAVRNNYYEEMIDIISPFLSSALKTNPHLGRAVLTGCLRAAKESIFTGLNNLLVCSLLDTGNNAISAGIGFTKEETETALAYYGLEAYQEEVSRNYDGYHFGTKHMYCPWDIMSFCYGNAQKLAEENAEITADNYWTNTNGNDVIEEFMGYIDPNDVDTMQSLLDGNAIITEVRPALCYGDLPKHDIRDFWTLLLNTGYLTFDPQYRSKTKNEYRLYIPNEEIRDCFKTKIMEFFETNPTILSQANLMIKALTEGDAEAVEDNLNKLLSRYVSIRDFAANAPKENYYHGFMNGLLVTGASLIEEQKSNFESDNWYIDLIIKPKINKRLAIILELKQTPDENKDKFLIAQDAVEQIGSRKYAREYIERADIREVLSYGICFCKKECTVVGKRLK